MPVYYRRHEEEDPVFHIYDSCPEGEKIEPQNRVLAVLGRRLCDACDTMHA